MKKNPENKKVKNLTSQQKRERKIKLTENVICFNCIFLFKIPRNDNESSPIIL